MSLRLCNGVRIPEYRSWLAMRARCHHKSYRGHAGRGITICERWENSFENFLSDMGKMPTDVRYTIERVDNDRGYEPGNCRWATYLEQARNKRNNRRLTFRGETHCVQEWADILGISRCTIKQRLKTGWTIEEALSLLGHAKHHRDPITNRFIPRKAK